MRIAIVTAWYPSKKNPLYGIFVQNQAKALSEYCSVTVMLLKWSLIPYQKEWKEDKVTIIEKGDFYFPNASEQFLNFWANRYVRFFKSKHEKQKFDLVHCHDHYGAFVGDKIKNELSIPFICTIHNSNIMNDKLVSWKQSYLTRILKNANRVISVGSKLAKVLETKYQINDVKVVPNYINTDQFSIKPQRISSEFRFIFVGGLEEHKGIMQLVRAFHIAEINNASLHIVGTGVLENKIKTFVKENQLDGLIVLHGNVSNQKIPELYNSANVCVSVSEYETFGVAILEAMSCGLPILFTASGGPNEIVASFAGVEIKERTVPGIIQGLKEIKEKYYSFEGEKIRAYVIEKYGFQQSIGVLLNEYKNLLDAKA